MPNLKLYPHLKDLLLNLYQADRPPKHLIVTLAMMLTGLFLGRPKPLISTKLDYDVELGTSQQEVIPHSYRTTTEKAQP